MGWNSAFLLVALSAVGAPGGVLGIGVTSTTTVGPVYANYGEPCGKLTDCDSGAFLTCINGSCQCALGKSMTFDDNSSSCWVLPGEKCIYRMSELGLSTFVPLDTTDERAMMRDRMSFRCVSHSNCEDGFCICENGYYATGNQTCERQLEHGEKCSPSNPQSCRESIHLTCLEDGKCGCNHTSSVFEESVGLCVGLAGSSCFQYELCTANAFCPAFGIFNTFDVRCTCKGGFYETANRTCEPRLGFGAPCKTNSECREDFSLICDIGHTNTCICNDTTHVFDSIEGRCLSKVNTYCDDDQNCVSNADCHNAGFLNGNVMTRNRICRCSYGYFTNGNKTCERQREFDESCETDVHCRNDLNLMCNTITHKCSCNDTTIYERSRKRCLSVVGTGTSCKSNDDCVPFSLCRSPGYLYPRHSPKAECVCKDGYVKSPEGYCLGKYGSLCESWTNSCQPSLACRSGECVCKHGRDQQYYDYQMEKCVTPLKASCSNDTVCVPNAACVPTPVRHPGVHVKYADKEDVCMCNDGFTEIDGTCFAMVASKCSEGESSYMPCVPNSKCSAGYCRCAHSYYSSDGFCEKKRAFGEKCDEKMKNESCQDSVCDAGGHCGCNAISMYDATKRTCLRLAGKSCVDMRDCVPNAKCTPGGLGHDATCICDEGYFPSQNGTCQWKKSYGETCNNNESQQCQSADDLICSVHGLCECDKHVSIYDETRKKCLRRHSAPCQSDQSCISNSKCQNPGYWVHYDSFSPHATCQCDKDAGFANSTDGRCVIDYYGGYCDDTLGKTCSSKFRCVDAHCQCPHEDNQIFDYKLKSCITLVKGPCDNSTGKSLCVKNAYCTTSDEGLSECKCKQGFIASNRGCELTFGQPCSQQSTVEGSEDPVCDRIAPLKCVMGTCQCGGDFQYYDYEITKCRGLIGARCDPETKGYCTEGAYCEPYRSAKKKFGRCKCMQNYATEDRVCTRIIP